ncbi:MAG: hypothetical protein IT270_11585 [Saprospiraceae bacterium]|nr:hypothetical protein [Saprospiraceae bacterium]
MKHWDKSKKDLRRSDERDFQTENNKKKKLKPVEKSKYRMKGYSESEE